MLYYLLNLKNARIKMLTGGTPDIEPKLKGIKNVTAGDMDARYGRDLTKICDGDNYRQRGAFDRNNEGGERTGLCS